MGVVGCLCGWWGDPEEADSHRDQVIEAGGECDFPPEYGFSLFHSANLLEDAQWESGLRRSL
jgi:hypothetical protein